MTLPAETAAKSFAWMDTRGNMGSIPVDTMLVDDWGTIPDKAAENGVKPLLTFKYSDQGRRQGGVRRGRLGDEERR